MRINSFTLNGSQSDFIKLEAAMSRCVADVHLICLPVSGDKRLLPASFQMNKGSRRRKVRTITLRSAGWVERLLAADMSWHLNGCNLDSQSNFLSSVSFTLSQMLSGEYYHKYLIPATMKMIKCSMYWVSLVHFIHLLSPLYQIKNQEETFWKYDKENNFKRECFTVFSVSGKQK